MFGNIFLGNPGNLFLETFANLAREPFLGTSCGSFFLKPFFWTVLGNLVLKHFGHWEPSLGTFGNLCEPVPWSLDAFGWESLQTLPGYLVCEPALNLGEFLKPFPGKFCEPCLDFFGVAFETLLANFVWQAPWKPCLGNCS